MTDPKALKTTAERRSLVMILCVVGLYLLMVQIHRTAGGVLATWFSGQRGFGPGQVAQVVGALFFASALVQLPLGMMYDRFGVRLTLGFSGLLAVVGILMFGLLDSAWELAVARFVIGIGHGGVITSIYLLAIAWVAPERVATVAALIIAVAGGIGSLLATTPLTLALHGVGLSATFLTLGALMLLVTLLVLLLVRDRPPGAAPPPGQGESLRESVAGVAAILLDRKLWPLFAMASCFAMPFFTVGGLWAGPYLRDVHGLSPLQASYVLLAMMAGLHVGTLAYGPLDRLCQSRKQVVLGGVSLAMLVLVVLICWPDLPLPLAVGGLLVFALTTPFYVVLAAHLRSFVSFDRAGRAVSSMNFMGLSMIFLMQYLSGWLMEWSTGPAGLAPLQGYRLVFAAVFGALLLAVAAYSRATEAPLR